MRQLGRRAGLTWLCAMALHAPAVRAAWDGETVSLRLENDATVSSDRHYTQGSFLSYLSRDNALAHWTKVVSENLPTFGYNVQATATLQPPAWQTIGLATADSSGSVTFLDTPPGGTPRFYRLATPDSP